MGLIYKHTNTINNKTYIGQTTQTMEERWKQHISDCKYKDYHFYKAIKKYGTDCWVNEIVAEYDNEILNEAEEYWVSYFDSFYSGYNSTTGGDSGYIISEETKRKMCIAQRGINHPLYGKHHSEETKEKIRESRRKYWEDKKRSI